MDHPLLLRLPQPRPARRPASAAPQSEIAEMREMFREISQRYMVYQPPAYYSALKRATDLALSLTAFISFIWLFPILALLVKLSSRGPVFFVQKRTGYKGAEFNCLKFRTMYVNDEAHIRQATADDKRITPIGKILRLTHLDELAQLINVIRGDMSIVGPRPHMLYHTRYYAQKIPFYNLRHEAKPGMTGMAQIKGYIGEINDHRELYKRIQWDVYYLKNRSAGLDIHIFFATIGQVFAKAFGVFKRREEE